MNLEPIFKSLVQALGERLSGLEREGKTFKTLSEDTICFSLAAGFMQEGLPAHSIEMEVRHPILAKESETAVDIRVLTPQGPIWIEVKFDKAVSGFNTHLGNLLNDLCRLALIQEGTALMLYISPKEMAEQLADFNRQVLGMDANPIALDEALFKKLPPYARKRLKELVIEKLDGTKVFTKYCGPEPIHSLVCLLYEVRSRP